MVTECIRPAAYSVRGLLRRVAWAWTLILILWIGKLFDAIADDDTFGICLAIAAITAALLVTIVCWLEVRDAR